MKQGSFSTSHLKLFEASREAAERDHVSAVLYFCFIVLQTGVKTTTTYHMVLTNESDLFVFLEFLCGHVLAGLMAFFRSHSLSLGVGVA